MEQLIGQILNNQYRLTSLLGDRSGHQVGQVYLVDFGSVQTIVHTCTRTIVGTPGYIPLGQFGYLLRNS